MQVSKQERVESIAAALVGTVVSGHKNIVCGLRAGTGDKMERVATSVTWVPSARAADGQSPALEGCRVARPSHFYQVLKT